jgi:hypothetical protein
MSREVGKAGEPKAFPGFLVSKLLPELSDAGKKFQR